MQRKPNTLILIILALAVLAAGLFFLAPRVLTFAPDRTQVEVPIPAEQLQ